MRLYEAIGIDEARGSGSFDYRYWFWAKKDSVYGLGYARQPIELDIQVKGKEATDALENIKKVVDELGEEPEKRELEIVEKKIKANTKRLIGIIDLFGSPIVISWLNRDPTTVVTVPREREGDVTDTSGKSVDVVRLFRDPETQEMVTDMLDWDRININDQEGDTLNTVMAKFISSVFGGKKKKSVRAFARGKGVEGIMEILRFKDTKKGIQVVPFKPQDYKMFPKDIQGSKKMVEYIQKLVDENFAKLLKSAREAF